jgi:hypothetical protein
MKRYGIADYLTDEQKRAAAQAVYDNLGERGQWITWDCKCPLGVALADRDVIADQSAPDAESVALCVVRERDDGWPGDARTIALRHAVEAAAAEFINDWDKRRIPPKQLARALGLESD